MEQRYCDLLEFSGIRETIAANALCADTAGQIRQEGFSGSVEELEALRERVRYVCTLFDQGGDKPAQELPAIAFLFDRLGTEGIALAQDEVFAIGLFLRRSAALRDWSVSGKEALRDDPFARRDWPNLAALEAEIFRVFDPEGGLRDLPEFRAIRSRIHAMESDWERISRRIGSEDGRARMLQSPVPTQRDGRMVLAVKANYRGRIPGIVHEVSQSGQTIFLEPAELVELNNLMRMAEEELAVEQRRVIRALTTSIGEQKEELVRLWEDVTAFDRIRARAVWSRVPGRVFAAIQERVALYQARHPLLGPDAVPIDLVFGEDTRAVIITGPNTGGKTVSLKTLGLLSLMNQFGLAIPAADGSGLPVFDEICADIGDEQSISQSLSTFSAHMKNISRILSLAGEHSLVLLDELGSGTDPQEGSAIAMALLDELLIRKTRIMVTTHHGILKNYGYTRESVENASVDFNPGTLSPTYRIVMGLPGESRALDIARRNGLDSLLVEAAARYLAGEHTDISRLIRGLESRHRALDEKEQREAQKTLKLMEKERRNDLAALRLRQRELELRSDGVRDLQALLEQSRKTLENLVRELRESGGEALDRSKTKAVKDFLADLDEELSRERAGLESLDRDVRDTRAGLTEDAQSESQGAKASVPLLAEGSSVKIRSSGANGTLVRPGKKGMWLVSLGSLKLSVHESDLLPLAPNGKPSKVEIISHESSAPAAQFELRLLGMRLDEALESLQQQLDAAVLQGLTEFSVIHGKGDGILSKGVHDYLKRQRVVLDYHFARPELGGFGKTIVTLKR